MRVSLSPISYLLPCRGGRVGLSYVHSPALNAGFSFFFSPALNAGLPFVHCAGCYPAFLSSIVPSDRRRSPFFFRPFRRMSSGCLGCSGVRVFYVGPSIFLLAFTSSSPRSLTNQPRVREAWRRAECRRRQRRLRLSRTPREWNTRYKQDSAERADSLRDVCLKRMA